MKAFVKKIVLLVVLLFCGVLFVVSHPMAGFRTFIVSSGSMEPAISTGSLVITTYTYPSILKKGDIITFIPPTTKREFVTHRITRVVHEPRLSTFKTKGDKNSHEDNWILAGGAVIGKVLVSVAYVGYFFAFIQSKVGIVLCILLPTIYLLLNEMQNIISLLKHHKKYSQEKTTVTVLCLIALTTCVLSAVQPTQALLSDSVRLTHNSFRTHHAKHHHKDKKHEDGDENENEDEDENHNQDNDGSETGNKKLNELRSIF